MVTQETINYEKFFQQDQANQPEENESGTVKKVLKKYIPHKNAERKKISRIVTQLYYIHQNEKIEDLAEDIKKDNTIRAIGVTDDEQKPLGVININELLQLLSRPYGRDVLRNHPVSEVMKSIRLFSRDRNILSVAEEIHNEMKLVNTTYFCLTEHNNTFAGIFSTRNMLLYLSEMTRKDIILAKTVQHNIMKDHNHIKTPNIEIVGCVCMAKEIGGDFYYIKEYEDHKWIISICDVSGKGIAASLVTSVLGGMMNIYDFSKSPDIFISQLNEYIYNTFGLERFVTGIFMHLDENTGNISFYDFGHSYIYILNGNKVFSLKSKEGNVPLGISLQITPKHNKITLKPGEILLLLTDGFFDQMNTKNNHYTIQRIAAIITKNKNKSFKEIKSIILEDFHKFRGTQPQIDDTTFIILKCNNNPS